jgi:hypothetical protein
LSGGHSFSASEPAPDAESCSRPSDSRSVIPGNDWHP